jgi:hypothetical protein
MARLALEQAPPPPLPRFPTIPREELSLLRRGEAQSVRPEYIEEAEYLRRREAGEDVVGQNFEPHPRFYRKRGGAIGSYRLPPPKAKGFSFFSPYEQDTSTGEFKYGGRSYRELERMGSMSGCAVPTYNPDPHSYWAYRPLPEGALAPLLRGGADRPPRSPSNSPPREDDTQRNMRDWGEYANRLARDNGQDHRGNRRLGVILEERNNTGDREPLPPRFDFTEYEGYENVTVGLLLQPRGEGIDIGVYQYGDWVDQFRWNDGDTKKTFLQRNPIFNLMPSLLRKIMNEVEEATYDEDQARKDMFGDGRRKQKK